MTSVAPPTRRPGDEADLGRPCPYCQSPLDHLSTVVTCGVCSAIHHDDCWDENTGCAVMGCVGADAHATAPTLVAPGATAAGAGHGLPITLTDPGAPLPTAPAAQLHAPPAAAPFAAAASTAPVWPAAAGPAHEMPLPAPGAFAPAPAPGPAPALPDPNLRALPNGATARIRSPWAVFGLTLLTFGFYLLYWWFQVNREMRDLGRGTGTDLGHSPGLSVAAYSLGGLVVVPHIWTLVGTTKRVARSQRAVASPASLDGWVAALLWLFTSAWGAVPYLQSQLNAVWRTLPTAPAGTGENRRTAALVAGIVALAFMIVGVTTAVILTRDDGSTVTTSQATTTSEDTTTDSTIAPGDDTTTTDTTSSDPEPVEPVDTNGVLPDADDSTMESDIADMLTEHHQDLVDGDFRGAWELLTTRKQAQNERRFGFAGWKAGQEAFAKYLVPTNISVTILDENPDTGVVTVDVRGMGWTNPSSSCTDWEGTTWVKYEDDEWRYDPGYSTTPQRQRDWKSRYDELMGAGC